MLQDRLDALVLLNSEHEILENVNIDITIIDKLSCVELSKPTGCIIFQFSYMFN